jgi:hypothetical protein
MSEIAVFPGASYEDEVPLNQPIAQFDEVAAFFAWQNRNRAAETAERYKWAKNPGYNASLNVPSYQPWEAPNLPDEDRDRIYSETKLNKFYELYQNFSPAAHVTVHSPDSAKFFDDIKCDYLGHSKHDEWFREISPTANHTPFDVQFDYDIGRIKHYTESGMVIHVRETSDPTAKTRAQKLFIVTANLMNGELKRLYAEDVQGEYAAPGLANSFNETIPLKSRHLGAVSGQYDIDTNNDFAVKYHAEIDTVLTKRQPSIRFQVDGLSFKPEGYNGFEKLHRIERLDDERLLLGKLALHAGQHLNERGAVTYSPERLSIAQ